KKQEAKVENGQPNSGMDRLPPTTHHPLLTTHYPPPTIPSLPPFLPSPFLPCPKNGIFAPDL
ncbi:MAG TPA: hypothetical protein PKM27_14620, partial [Saprospiraceae bacterium]|nr:hypothetical protein [Saprospiraceae bacterium]HNT22000.1 hypothetical protein [Saprospiraceae bacterium]